MMFYIVVGLLNPHLELNVMFYVTLVVCMRTHTHTYAK